MDILDELRNAIKVGDWRKVLGIWLSLQDKPTLTDAQEIIGDKLALLKPTQDILPVFSEELWANEDLPERAKQVLAKQDERQKKVDRVIKFHMSRTAPIYKIGRDPIVGFVYLMYSPKKHIYKIGMSKQPSTRVIQLRGQIMDKKLKLIWQKWSNNAWVEEHNYHARYAHRRLFGEWFDLTPADVAEIIDSAPAIHQQSLFGDKW